MLITNYSLLIEKSQQLIPKKIKMNKKILQLAIPNIISNLTIPLVGLVDFVLMGHQESEFYMGAVAIGATGFLFIYSAFGFLRMGTAGFTAQSYGEKNFEKSISHLSRAFIVAIIVGLLLIAFQKPLGELLFYLIKGTPKVEKYARQYFYIRIWAAPATLSIYVFTGWFIGMQNAKSPMLATISINVINIVTSIFFVRYYGMTTDGVALGTVIAQYVGFLICLILFFRYYRKLLKYFSLKGIQQIIEIKAFITVNFDILIRSVLLTGTFFYFNAKSAQFGAELLAVNSVLLQFLWIFSYFIDGFAFAAESLTGKYIGAKNLDMLKKSIKKLFLFGLWVSLPFTIIYLFFGRYLIAFLTNVDSVKIAAIPYMVWVVVIPIITFSAFIWDGIYIGATASKTMRNSMIISSLLVFLPAFYLFENIWGNHGLWLALMLFMFSRGVFLAIQSPKNILTKAM